MSYKARVPLASVSPSGKNPRRDFGNVGALARSIEATGGQPVNPIVVADVGDGADGQPEFRIVDGERRYRALLELGAEEADVLVCPSWSEAEDAVAMMATDEKKSLTDEERARGFQGMLSLGVGDETVSGASGVGVDQVRRVRRMVRSEGFEAPDQLSLDALIEASAFDDPADRGRVLRARDPRTTAAQIRERRACAAARDALRPAMEAALPSIEWAEGRPPRSWDRPDGLAFVGFVRSESDVSDLASEREGDDLVAWACDASWSVWRRVDRAAEDGERARVESLVAAGREAGREFRASVSRWLCGLPVVPTDVASLVRAARRPRALASALGLDPSSEGLASDVAVASAMDSDPSLFEAVSYVGGVALGTGTRLHDGEINADEASRADDLWCAAEAGGWDPSASPLMAAELAAWDGRPRGMEVGS